jgi:hypothetical protein
MRRLLFLVLLLAAFSGVAQTPEPATIPEIVRADRWSLAEGTHDGKRVVLRFRDGFRNRPDLSSYPRLVRVVWTYQSDATGMPDSQAGDQMGVFEDRLIEAVEPSQTAALVAVITTDGRREWMYYTSDAEEFDRRLTEMPQEKHGYPIEVSTEHDPEWSALYEEILSGLEE